MHKLLIIVFCIFLMGFVFALQQCTKARVCVSDLRDTDCPAGEILKYNPEHLFGCCPTCQPGVIEAGKCRPPSDCMPDGSYAPVQCKGDLFTGRCFCSDKNGHRIFGQMWKSDAKEMSCACSRRRAELEAFGKKVVTLHCTPTGDYEPLQCDDGLCWCVQHKTGQPTVAPVHQENMKMLSCYSSKLLGVNYLRKCESVTHALAMIHKEQSEHGTIYHSRSKFVCDFDGSYGSLQIQGTSAYCTGKDGSILGPWSAELSKMTEMNCNCARDTEVYFPEHGMTVTETCESNGNYKTLQNIGDYFYCVDSDGYVMEPCPLLEKRQLNKSTPQI